MRYMVVERFKDPVFERLASQGRSIPEEVRYVGSWVSSDLQGCFQLMEATDRSYFNAWIASWEDLVEFEVVPVISSSEAAERALNA